MTQTVSEIAALWDRVLLNVKDQIDDQKVYDSFFVDSYIQEIDGQNMIICVNSGVAAAVLGTKYYQLIHDAVQKSSGTEFELKFFQTGEYKSGKKIETKPTYFEGLKIFPQFTFKNFVVGSSNKEAYQASLMTSKPGAIFNPLFIYSDSGLGKTHLLHAIGNALKEESPSKKVLYVSSTDFVEEFVKSFQGSQGTQKFIDYFKESVDVLLFDDIQWIIGKKQTADCFFTIFQTLYTRGKQIVITSDQPPAVLEGLPERLKTRFAQGLTVTMSSPDIDTAIAILKTKIETYGLPLEMFDEEVLRFYGERFSSSVRTLEGALNKLFFYTINTNKTTKIDINVGKAAVKDLLNIQEEEGKLSEKKIIQTVADFYNLTYSQLTGKIRTAQIALARHISMYLIRTLLDTPFDKIGNIFSGKDHSTVMSGITKVEKMLKTDSELLQVINELKNTLKSN